jgi:hypothetical protein
VWIREEFPAKIEEYPMEPNNGLLQFSAFEPDHADVFGAGVRRKLPAGAMISIFLNNRIGCNVFVDWVAP